MSLSVDQSAPAGAIAIHPRSLGAARRLIAEVGQRSAEFPTDLANHLPMVIEAMARLGARPERLAEYAERYTSAHAVPMPPPAVAPIAAETWTDHLGERARETDYRDFFADRVGRFGGAATIRSAMPVLQDVVAASATHGLMRLAYGVLRRDEAEIAIALGYWAATALPLRPAPLAERNDVADPLAQIAAMRPISAFKDVAVSSTLLWKWIEAMGAIPEFQALLGRLAPHDAVLGQMRQASLALYAATMSFEALHAVTGCHWLRLVAPHVDAPGALAVRFWEVVLSLYAKIDMPRLPDASVFETMRAAALPPDAEIAAAAVASDDEHDHSLVFSALEEFKLTGDPLYRMVAARRVGLI